MVDVGAMRERIGVLRLAYDGDARAYRWETERSVWASAIPDERINLFSSAGIGVRGTVFTVRHDAARTLHNAYCWNGKHCFLTAIRAEEPARGFDTVKAAVCESVTLTARPQDRTGRDALNRPVAVAVPGFTFPGILTERYFRNDAEDVYRAELQQRVLVTPKPIALRAGDLVQQDTEPPYTVRQVLDLDPYKNEYVLERRWDA